MPTRTIIIPFQEFMNDAVQRELQSMGIKPANNVYDFSLNLKDSDGTRKIIEYPDDVSITISV